MVVYVARCHSLNEAKALQDKFAMTCPTLVSSRILTKPADLHVYDADLLRTEDEAISVGEISFDREKAYSEEKWKKLLILGILGMIVGAAVALFSINVFTTTRPSPFSIAAAAFGILLTGSFLAVIGLQALEHISPQRRALWSAERWLKAGRPVVIAASDELPDGSLALPRNIFFFDQNASSKPEDKKSA
ncbi:MAG: hypothetical protein AB1540_10475 [Bdellovibrionota bacterium]